VEGGAPEDAQGYEALAKDGVKIWVPAKLRTEGGAVRVGHARFLWKITLYVENALLERA